MTAEKPQVRTMMLAFSNINFSLSETEANEIFLATGMRIHNMYHSQLQYVYLPRTSPYACVSLPRKGFLSEDQTQPIMFALRRTTRKDCSIHDLDRYCNPSLEELLSLLKVFFRSDQNGRDCKLFSNLQGSNYLESFVFVFRKSNDCTSSCVISIVLSS
jgi:hypothetical protein